MVPIPLSNSTILAAIKATGFGDRAMRYRADERFDQYEMTYKIRLAKAIREANHAYADGNAKWVELMTKAIASNDNNLVTWRVKKKPFKDWCSRHPKIAGEAIHRLITGKEDVEKRIDRFAATLDHPGMNQAGAKLCLASVLLMARDIARHPPVRTDVVNDTLQALNLDWATRSATVSGRYAMFMVILDALVQFTQRGPHVLSDRLEAQGAVWCVLSRWMDEHGPRKVDGEAGSAEQDIAKAKEDLALLSETERSALIAARRGQGRYRSGLINLWLGCSVTGCKNVGALRASHLKPWRLSNNQERLDAFNGLLLTPNLDLLLDRHLISFSHEGSILISRSLSKEDCAALGLNRQMRIRGLQRKHLSYLAFHRSKFLEPENA